MTLLIAHWLNHFPVRGYPYKIGEILGAKLEIQAVYHHFYGINRKAAAGGDFGTRKAVGKIAQDVRFTRGNVYAVTHAV